MLNDCFYRNRDRHELLLMYDLDEALVFRRHVDLHAFYDSLGAPVAALRTQSAWARVDLEGLGGLSAEALTVDSLAARPLTRAAVHYSREKYAVNTSRAAGVSLVNVHGVYQVACAPRMTLPATAAAQGWSQALLDEAGRRTRAHGRAGARGERASACALRRSKSLAPNAPFPPTPPRPVPSLSSPPRPSASTSTSLTWAATATAATA